MNEKEKLLAVFKQNWLKDLDGLIQESSIISKNKASTKPNTAPTEPTSSSTSAKDQKDFITQHDNKPITQQGNKSTLTDTKGKMDLADNSAQNLAGKNIIAQPAATFAQATKKYRLEQIKQWYN